MMISIHPSSKATCREHQLELLLQAEDEIDEDLVSLSSIGDKLVLQGRIASYALKCRVEKLARDAGFTEVENCLRVVPGAPGCAAF